MPEKVLKKLAKQYHLTLEQLEELLALVEDEDSVLYVLRYRKDLAGNLDVEHVDDLLDEKRQLDALEKEKAKILEKLEEQGLLGDELKEKVENSETMRELIDHYVPYRPRKRSRSRHALTQGLEPLARAVFTQETPIALMSEAAVAYVGVEGGPEDAPEALDGAFHIISDWIAEEKGHRDRQRGMLREQGQLVSRRVGRSLPARLRGELRDYMEFRKLVTEVHPHQVLSLMSGKRLKALDFGVEAPLVAMCHMAAGLYMAGGPDQFAKIDNQFHEAESIPEGEKLGELSGAEFLYFCIRHSLCDVLAPILVRELEREFCEDAEHYALEIVRRNLRARLMAKPLAGKRVLGVAPGYRTGCKLAALDEAGQVLETTIVYPHTPRMEVDDARTKIRAMIDEHSLSVAAVGDGTASQETEELISGVIKDLPEFRYAVMSSEEATAYAGSPGAGRDLPDMTPDLQAAVFIGRRLLDPLEALTKISLRSLCPPQYSQDIAPAALKRATGRVVSQCVAEVGVDPNAASPSMLKWVPGLSTALATEIAQYRDANGPIAGRKALREVPKIDEDVWRRCAGFVRFPASDDLMDATRIHPEHYGIAATMIEKMEGTLASLKTEEGRAAMAQKRADVKFTELEKQFGVHFLVLKDVLDELVDPWSDARKDGEPPVLRAGQLTFESLQPDQELIGVVRKIVPFGAFVDVGVGEDGLVHISELSDKFIHDPHDIVAVGDRINVRVVEVDAERRRIALSRRPAGTRRPPSRRPGPSRPRTESRDRPTTATTSTPRPDVPTLDSKSGGARPHGTAGKQSRRVQRAASFSTAKPEPKPAKPKVAPQKSEKQGEPQKVSDLLKKLDFAAIERRGGGEKPEGEEKSE